MTITVSTDDRRSVKALEVYATADRWQKGHRHDGRSFYAVPSSSEPNLLHLTDTRECSCQDFQLRRLPCKHVLAVRMRVAVLGGTARLRTEKPRLPGPAAGTVQEVKLSVPAINAILFGEGV